MYTIEKAPAEMVNLSKSRGFNAIPLHKMKVGEMIRDENSPSRKTKYYNAIKYRRNFTRECEGWVFTVKTLNEKEIACIRVK